MFEIYWGFLRTILGDDHDLLVCNDKQWKAYETVIKHPESLNHRSRRGGKTLLLSHMCCFFNILRFGKGSLSGKVIYRCPRINQLKGLRQWLKLNPFYIKSRKAEYEVDFFDQLWPLDLACLSDSTCVGLECAVLIEDEYSTIKKDTQMHLWMKDSRAFLAKGEIWEKRHIHASSGRKNSPFEDDYLYLHANDPAAVIVMPWAECPWITKSYIDKEKAKNFMNTHWIDEQYDCQWVLASGSFFDQSKLHIIGLNDQYEDVLATVMPTSGGVDFNGEVVGHILLLMHYDKQNTLYLFKEIVFQHVYEIAAWIKEHPEITVEVEGTETGRGGGYNAGFAANLQEYECECQYNAWNDEMEKPYRLFILGKCDVFVSPECPWFIRNFKAATFDPAGDKHGRPKLLKTADQHGLDCCLHGIAAAGDIDIIKPRGADSFRDQEFNQLVDSIKMR